MKYYYLDGKHFSLVQFDSAPIHRAPELSKRIDNRENDANKMSDAMAFTVVSFQPNQTPRGAFGVGC